MARLKSLISLLSVATLEFHCTGYRPLFDLRFPSGVSAAAPTSFYSSFGSSSSVGRVTIETSDGSYLFAANSDASISNIDGQGPLNAYSGAQDFLVVKMTREGAVLWYTYLGGSGADYPNAIAETNDGGFVIIGYSDANVPSIGGQAPIMAFTSGTDWWVIKISAAGIVQWHTFIGAGAGDQGYGVVPSSDGGVVLCGSANADIPTMNGQTPLRNYSALYDPLVVKLAADGTVSWYEFLGGATDFEHALWISKTSDGGYILAGYAFGTFNLGPAPILTKSAGYDGFVIRLTSAGAVSWYTFLGAGGNDFARSVAETSDGGFIVAMHSSATIASMNAQSAINPYSAGNDALAVKLDNGGSVSWFTFIGGSGTDEVYNVARASDGGFAFAGRSNVNIPNIGSVTPNFAYSMGYDFFVFKLNSSGGLSWYSFYGGNTADEGYHIAATSDGGFAVSGYASGNIPQLGAKTPLYPYASGSAAFLLKIKSDGTL